jgi:hypothetical protein
LVGDAVLLQDAPGSRVLAAGYRCRSSGVTGVTSAAPLDTATPSLDITESGVLAIGYRGAAGEVNGVPESPSAAPAPAPMCALSLRQGSCGDAQECVPASTTSLAALPVTAAKVATGVSPAPAAPRSAAAPAAAYAAYAATSGDEVPGSASRLLPACWGADPARLQGSGDADKPGCGVCAAARPNSGAMPGSGLAALAAWVAL